MDIIKNLNDKRIYNLTDQIFKLEEYYSIEDYGNLLTVQTCLQTNKALDFFLNSKIFITPPKDITDKTLRVNFEVDKKPKEIFIEKAVLTKVYAICKINSENNKFIKIITNRTEKFDVNDILQKMNELRSFKGVLKSKLNIDEFPLKTYYLEEKPEINKDNNSDDIEKEFILKKNYNGQNNNNQIKNLIYNNQFQNSGSTIMIVNNMAHSNNCNNIISNQNVNLLYRRTYDGNLSYQDRNINNGTHNNNNNQVNNNNFQNNNLNQINLNQNFYFENLNTNNNMNNAMFNNNNIQNILAQNNNLFMQIISYIQQNNNNNLKNINIFQEIKNLYQINNNIQNNQNNMDFIIHNFMLMNQKFQSLFNNLYQIFSNNMNQIGNNNMKQINNNNINQNIQNNNYNMNNQQNNNNNQISNFLQPIIIDLNKINYNLESIKMILMNNNCSQFNNYNNVKDNNILDKKNNNNENIKNNEEKTKENNTEKKNIDINFKLIEYEDYFPLIGLRNVGLTCYMNSILQCLLHIPELNSFFINTYPEHKKKLKIINKDTETHGKLCEEFHNIVMEAYINHSQKYNYISPKKFNTYLSNVNPQFAKYEANDAKDLLLYLFQSMHAELNYYGDQKLKNVPKCNQLIEKESFDFFMTVNNNLNLSIISYLFYGVHKSTTICKGCNSILYNFQYFQFLSFPTFNFKNDKFNIYKGFKEFVKPEIMSGDNQCYCQKCKGLRDAKVTTKIYYTPPYLIINIDYGKNKRYSPSEVTFGGIIDIKDFVDEKNWSPSIQYKLIAVNTHLGRSGSSGHYITYCQNNEDKWYEFNDSSVSETKFEKVNSNSPYVLIYKKL